MESPILINRYAMYALHFMCLNTWYPIRDPAGKDFRGFGISEVFYIDFGCTCISMHFILFLSLTVSLGVWTRKLPLILATPMVTLPSLIPHRVSRHSSARLIWLLVVCVHCLAVNYYIALLLDIDLILRFELGVCAIGWCLLHST